MMFSADEDVGNSFTDCWDLRSSNGFQTTMALLFTEYDAARNSHVLHCHFSVPRATSYSVNSQATVATFIMFVAADCESVYCCWPRFHWWQLL